MKVNVFSDKKTTQQKIVCIILYNVQNNIIFVDNQLPFTILMFKRWTFGAVLNALVSVDTFFTLR